MKEVKEQREQLPLENDAMLRYNHSLKADSEWFCLVMEDLGKLK